MATFGGSGVGGESERSSSIPIPTSGFSSAFSLTIDTNSTLAESYDTASSSTMTMPHKNSPAFETTLDSYATRILQSQCPPQVKMEPSVGPYLTSIIRSSLHQLQEEQPDLLGPSNQNVDMAHIVTLLSDYDSLVEFLEEHCSMTPAVALSALTQIVSAMQTGIISDQHQYHSLGVGAGAAGLGGFSSSSSVGSFGRSNTLGGFGSTGTSVMNNNRRTSSRLGRYRSKSMGAESDYNDFESLEVLGNMLKATDLSPTLGAGGLDDTQKSTILSPRTNELASSAIFPSWGSNLDLGSSGGAPLHEDIGPIKEEPSCIEDDEPSFFMEDGLVVQEKTPSKDKDKLTLNRTPKPPEKTEDSSSNEYGSKALKISPMAPAFTPLKPDRLIPVDLLGVIDDPSTPSGGLEEHIERRRDDFDEEIEMKGQECHTPEPMPASEPITATSTPNTVTSASTSPSIQGTLAISSTQGTSNNASKPKKKMSKNTDLAATLFSRPRSKSLCHGEKSPKLKPLAAPHVSVIGLSGLSSCSASAVMTNSIPALFQKQLDSAVQILLAMNYDICEEAAYEAALVSNADVNVAQHVIDGAVSAPPVCRHLMNGGCYRSDCHYSHDIDGHTCLFWLRGRCNPNRKGEACRFMHGFSEKLLEGVNLDYTHRADGNLDPSSRDLSSAGASSAGTDIGSKPIPIKTSNLVQHNIMSSFSNPKEGHLSSFNSRGGEALACSPGGSPLNYPSDTSSAPTKSGSFFKAHSVGSGELLPPANSIHSSKRLDPTPAVASTISSKGTKRGSSFSFASIASKGYKEKSSFHKSTSSAGSDNAVPTTSKSMKSVRIPQDLWNASYNRSSSAFHISDPLSRYKEVSASVSRHDVIDLHFQSVKSFPIVLETVLSEKLRDHGEVWVVTGSGHHVNRNSHQKGGGVLETSVIGWLTSNDYEISKGKDKNGHGGAVLVHGKNR